MTGKKLVTLTLIMLFVMALMGGLATAEEPCERYGQGYWKQWLAENDGYKCPFGFTAEELLGMLNTPARGDANQILVYQFIAASLNVNVNGCTPPPAVAEALMAAYAHLMGDVVSDDRSEILGWKDILEFWNENKQAVLESAVYEGMCELFGSHEGDTMTFTFSNDIFQDGEMIMGAYFEGGNHYRIRSAADVMDWEIEGNVLTVTATSTFSIPRDYIGAFVIYFEGLVDLIGNDVVVPDEGVEVEGNPIYPTFTQEGTFTSHSNYYLPDTEWNYSIAITVDCYGVFVSGTIVLEDYDGNEILADIAEVKYDYAYWSSHTPNVAVVGQATYLGETYSFMALYAEVAMQMALSETDYLSKWGSESFYNFSERAYNIHSTLTNDFPIFWQ